MQKVSTTRLAALVVEDHPVTRLGISTILRTIADLDSIAEVESIDQAREALCVGEFSLLILALGLRDTQGEELAREVRATYPHLCLVVLTPHESPLEAHEAAHTTFADALLAKRQARRSLAETVVRALAGRGLLEARPRRAARGATLSKRELQVLALVVRGHTNAVIGEKLGISWTTVRTHVVHVLEKLGARDRTEAASMAIQLGLLNGDKRFCFHDNPS